MSIHLFGIANSNVIPILKGKGSKHFIDNYRPTDECNSNFKR